MEIKDFKQAMKLQQELSAKLETTVDRLTKKKAPPMAETVKDLDRLIASAMVELKTSEGERELAIKRWELRVEQRKATVERLEKDLKELKERLEHQKQTTKKKVTKKSPIKKKTTKKKVLRPKMPGPKRAISKKKR